MSKSRVSAFGRCFFVNSGNAFSVSKIFNTHVCFSKGIFHFCQTLDFSFIDSSLPKMAILDLQIFKIQVPRDLPNPCSSNSSTPNMTDCLNRNPAELGFESAQPHKEPFLLLLCHCHVTRTANEHRHALQVKHICQIYEGE